MKERDRVQSPAASLAQRRVYWSTVGGLKVLCIDFSAASTGEKLAMLADGRAILEKAAPDSVLILSDLTQMDFDAATANKWKALGVEFYPRIRGMAFYGSTGVLNTAVGSYVALTHWFALPGADRKIRVFKAREQAVEWLLKRKSAA